MKFRKVKVEDFKIVNNILQNQNESASDMSFLNLLIWQPYFNNEISIDNNVLYVKSNINGEILYKLPCGGNMKESLNEIINENEKTLLWVQEGTSLNEFAKAYYGNYILEQNFDASDYIYNTSDLANLGGKKYHSKRNHISAFKKKYNWRYETMSKENISDAKACANEWYSSFEQLDSSLKIERQGIELMLENFENFKLKGGILYCDDKPIAFTIGSEISNEVFDVHVEKALREYQGAYTMINNQFVINELSDYKYINREDDMGLEGLRKAKLSYYPSKLLKKYNCTVNVSDLEKCRFIYEQAFSKTENFDDILFSKFFKFCHYKKVNGNIVSMLFLFPCTIKTESGNINAKYLYAAATDSYFRGNGYMSELIEEVLSESEDVVILKPATEELCNFYERLGFSKIVGIKSKKTPVMEHTSDISSLINNKENDNSKYTLMVSKDININELHFIGTME